MKFGDGAGRIEVEAAAALEHGRRAEAETEIDLRREKKKTMTVRNNMMNCVDMSLRWIGEVRMMSDLSEVCGCG